MARSPITNYALYGNGILLLVIGFVMLASPDTILSIATESITLQLRTVFAGWGVSLCALGLISQQIAGSHNFFARQTTTRALFIWWAGIFYGTLKMVSHEKYTNKIWNPNLIYGAWVVEGLLCLVFGYLGFLQKRNDTDEKKD